jgi:uncharacterized protein with ParB-like and HNH nuclease domain
MNFDEKNVDQLDGYDLIKATETLFSATKEGGDGDEENFRDKDKEKTREELVKKQLSKEAVNVIESNEREFDEIIESLKKKGISAEEGVGISKMRTVSRDNNRVRGI